MIVAIVISHPVSSRRNRHILPCIAWLPLLLSLVVADLHAIDVIEFSAASVIYDNKTVTDVHGQIQLETDEDVSFTVDGLLAEERLKLNGALKNDNWRLSTRIDSPASQLLEQYRHVMGELPQIDITGEGRLDLTVSGTMADPARQRITYQADLTNLTGELVEPAAAFEGLTIRLTGNARYLSGSIRGQAEIDYRSGLLAYGDVLIEPLAGPIHIKTKYVVDNQHLDLSGFRLSDPGGLDISMPEFSASLSDPVNRHQASVNVELARFPHVYNAWLQPILYDTIMQDIESEGELSAQLTVKDRIVNSLSADLNDLSLADRSGRFSIYGLESHLRAEQDFTSGEFSLSWQGAELYRILLGSTDMRFDMQDHNLVMRSPFSIPLYDGELKVFNLAMQELRADHPTVIFDGVLTPVSLTAVSSAMEWPTLHGSISGVIPGVRYDGSELKVDGVLLAKAFDGTFRIEHLRMSDLLGPLPRLSADFRVDHLDLEKLTRAFDFGRIEGRLSGHIAGLTMVDWQPTTFDAFFYTPEDDDSKHIISQQAVDNLTSLSGSDIGSVLSRTYLRFFENFRYERLGISCILRNDVCRMSGIEAATGSGYYIVKGGLLPPRLDIIGYSHEVDWSDLLGRLDRVLSDNTPVIQ